MGKSARGKDRRESNIIETPTEKRSVRREDDFVPLSSWILYSARVTTEKVKTTRYERKGRSDRGREASGIPVDPNKYRYPANIDILLVGAEVQLLYPRDGGFPLFFDPAGDALYFPSDDRPRRFLRESSSSSGPLLSSCPGTMSADCAIRQSPRE